MSNQNASIRLSTEHKGRRRREPVWIGRYRIVGRDSAKVLGRAWTKRSQAPDGYLTHSQAEAALRPLLAAEGAAVRAARGATFDEVAEVYVTSLRGRIKNGPLLHISRRPPCRGRGRRLPVARRQLGLRRRPVGLERQTLNLWIDHDMKQADIAHDLSCSQM